MWSKARGRVRRILSDYIHSMVDGILQDKGIPLREEWEERIRDLNAKEDSLNALHKRYNEERRMSISPVVSIENDFCMKCERPHFQQGLCLLHFHQRYSTSMYKGSEI